MKNLMISKQAVYKSKWKVYHSQVTAYNIRFPEFETIQLLPYDVCKSLNLDDDFWNFGTVTHSDKLWSYDAPTRVGIQAHLKVEQCHEELRRIAREVRSLISWSINSFDKLADLEIYQANVSMYFMTSVKWR